MRCTNAMPLRLARSDGTGWDRRPRPGSSARCADATVNVRNIDATPENGVWPSDRRAEVPLWVA